MQRSFLTRSLGAEVVDERAVRGWLQLPDAIAAAGVDVALYLTVLEMLLDVVEASVFVIASDGQIVLANARGTALHERRGQALRDVLRAGMAHTNASDSEPVRWSAGLLRGWRRSFVVDQGDAHALVVVDELRSAVDGVVERAVRAWTLTTRQAEVFRLVIEGRANKEIAVRLGCACRTVEVHITTLFEKAGVDSRARLIAKTWDLAEQGRLRLRCF